LQNFNFIRHDNFSVQSKHHIILFTKMAFFSEILNKLILSGVWLIRIEDWKKFNIKSWIIYRQKWFIEAIETLYVNNMFMLWYLVYNQITFHHFIFYWCSFAQENGIIFTIFYHCIMHSRYGKVPRYSVFTWMHVCTEYRWLFHVTFQRKRNEDIVVLFWRIVALTNVSWCLFLNLLLVYTITLFCPLLSLSLFDY